VTMSAYSYPKFVDLLGSAPPCPSPCYRSEVLVSGPSLISPQNPGAVGKNPPAPPERRNHEITQITEGSPLSGGFGLSVWCVRGDETLARLPLRAQDGCEGASFMACAHIEGGEVHSPSVAAIAGAFYASISLFEQDPSRIGFSFEPRL